ncbi:MAG: hypothetical protein ACOC6S_00100 [Chloroflexota bacterium]
MHYKRNLPMLIALFFAAVILGLSCHLGLSAFSWVIYVSFVTVGLFIIYFFITQLVARLRQSIWPMLVTNAVLVYLGLLIISTSKYKGLIEKVEWDIGMVALGGAVVAFGFGLHTQSVRKEERPDSSENEMSELTSRIQGLSKKLDELEDVADGLITKCQRVDEKITPTAKKEDGEGKDVSA